MANANTFLTAECRYRHRQEMTGSPLKMLKIFEHKWKEEEATILYELISTCLRFKKKLTTQYCFINVRIVEETARLKEAEQNSIAAGINDESAFGFGQMEFFLVIQTDFMKELFKRYVLF